MICRSDGLLAALFAHFNKDSRRTGTCIGPPAWDIAGLLTLGGYRRIDEQSPNGHDGSTVGMRPDPHARD